MSEEAKALRKQINRDEKSLWIKNKRKRQLRREIMVTMLIVVLWFVAVFSLVNIKGKLEEPRDIYKVMGVVEQKTNSGYYITLKSNGEKMFFETDETLSIGKSVTVEMNGNCTLDESDDFIEYAY